MREALASACGGVQMRLRRLHMRKTNLQVQEGRLHMQMRLAQVQIGVLQAVFARLRAGVFHQWANLHGFIAEYGEMRRFWFWL